MSRPDSAFGYVCLSLGGCVCLPFHLGLLLLLLNHLDLAVFSLSVAVTHRTGVLRGEADWGEGMRSLATSFKSTIRICGDTQSTD